MDETNGHLPHSATRIITPQASPRAGVGLVFKETGEGVLVQSVLKGGGAASSLCPPKAGDLLVSVDSLDVRRQTLAKLRPMLVGDEGSRVTLAFEDAAGRIYTTHAQRRVPQFHYDAWVATAGDAEAPHG